MNRLAASHPEDDRYQTSEGQREVLSEKADRRDETSILHYMQLPDEGPLRNIDDWSAFQDEQRTEER